MKIIVAPDKFKGTLTARQVAAIEAEEIHALHPEWEVVQIPLADGGEGTVDTLTAALNGRICKAPVRDPFGRLRLAEYGMAGATAILEMASASGMALLKPSELNPLRASSAGTGDLILAALDAGAKEIIIGIGGSATIDGGCGMAETLGIRFFDRTGNPLSGLCGAKLSEIGHIDVSSGDPRIRHIKIRIASDVTNPLLGENGAAAVFGPQKGATLPMIAQLENGLANLRWIAFEQGILSGDLSGDGAAGGLGFGLRAFCNAVSESGAQLAMRLTKMENRLDGADLLITGEGRTDTQTENGKLCLELAKLCRQKKIPAILLSGIAEGNPGNLFSGVYSTIVQRGIPFETIRREAAQNLRMKMRELISEIR